MGRTSLCILLLGGLLLLSGCSSILQPSQDLEDFEDLEDPEDTGLSGTFTVQIISDGPKPSVVVRAHDRKADRYTWEFYGADTSQDPTIVEGGRERSVATHTWPEIGPGAFLIVLTVESGDPEEGEDGGCCGPGPGGTGGGMGGGSSDGYQIASSYQVVRFAGCAGLVPILFFTTWNGGRVGSTFYPWEKVCVNAMESVGEGLTYRIEIVRVVSENDPTPIPPDWATSVQYILTDDPLYCFYIPGPGGCSGDMWTYRVTLRIRDRWWKEATLTKFILVGCCP